MKTNINEKNKNLPCSIFQIANSIGSYSESYYLRPFVIEKEPFNQLMNSCDLIVIRCFDDGDLGRIITQVVPKHSKVLVIRDEPLQYFLSSFSAKKIAVFMPEETQNATEQLSNYKHDRCAFNSEYISDQDKRIILVYERYL